MTAQFARRIDSVFLPVKDLDKAVKWYQDKFGLELAWKTDEVASFRLGETPLTLLQYAFPGLSKEPKDFHFIPSTGILFNLYVDNILEAYDVLKYQKVDVTEIIDHGSVKDFIVTDLDGNKFGIVTWPAT